MQCTVTQYTVAHGIVHSDTAYNDTVHSGIVHINIVHRDRRNNWAIKQEIYIIKTDTQMKINWDYIWK